MYSVAPNQSIPGIFWEYLAIVLVFALLAVFHAQNRLRPGLWFAVLAFAALMYGVWGLASLSAVTAWSWHGISGLELNEMSMLSSGGFVLIGILSLVRWRARAAA
jgi:hypothetical protein